MIEVPGQLRRSSSSRTSRGGCVTDLLASVEGIGDLPDVESGNDIEDEFLIEVAGFVDLARNLLSLGREEWIGDLPDAEGGTDWSLRGDLFSSIRNPMTGRSAFQTL
ncbi:hypothetical protein ZIOFF_021967 [Zingiber officinale]|uniref:Uncharacterized protein n=1 Tax=Zingiber officinale TaxID=94328 RepID=A0A8J5LGW2_ZINOF|nr:hypothetical protein ZIOFF_021967 [Zingiber officinale]